MKKKIFLSFGVILLLASCTNETNITDFNATTNNQIQSNQESLSQATDNEVSLWNQSIVDSSKNADVLKFETGLKIILPENWRNQVVISVSSNQGRNNMLLISEKSNKEAGACGVIFCLTFVNRDIALNKPFEILEDDSLLGIYEQDNEEYALLLQMPQSINYVKGNEDMKKVYESFRSSINAVQIETEEMIGFTKCEIDAIDWIKYKTEDISFHLNQYTNKSIVFEYPDEWTVTEVRGQDGLHINISNPNIKNGAVFSVEQREAWCVNLERTKSDYQELLSESYQELEIIELAKTVINECDACKLVFTYTDNVQNRTMISYMTVAGLVSFQLNYSFPTQQKTEYEKILNPIIESVKFSVIND